MIKNKEKKINIKLFTILDIKKSDYIEWLKDEKIVRYLYRQELFDTIKEKDIKIYVSTLIKSKKDFFYSISFKKKIIGTIKIGHIDWYSRSGDLGIMIGDKNYWNKGFASQAIKLILRLAKKELNLRKIVAGTPSPNIAMIKAFKKNGFKIEGKRIKQLLISNKYVDHILLGKIL